MPIYPWPRLRAGIRLAVGVSALVVAPSAAAFIAHETVDFRVDPTTIDDDNDGFITGTEFSPVGSDGTVFTLTPTNNLVGGNRFLLDATDGLLFGGGGGSTLSFDFSTDRDIVLDGYVLASSGFILGNPIFDIREGADVLSAGNDAMPNGLTSPFNSAPIAINAGTTYSFVANNTGAAILSFMQEWHYTPEPASATAAALGLLVLARRRRC